jgi:hypothetical protein
MLKTKSYTLALQGNIEKINEEKLLHNYQIFYYPAQLYHVDKDDPKQIADLIFKNDC